MSRITAIITGGIVLLLATVLLRSRSVNRAPTTAAGLDSAATTVSAVKPYAIGSSGTGFAADKSPTSVPPSLRPSQLTLEPPRNLEQLASLLKEIRALEPGTVKDAALVLYLGIREPSLATAVIDELVVESDRVIRDHHVMLLQRLADNESVRKLVLLIDRAGADPGRQELLLSVFENMTSAAAMQGLAEIVRNPAFTFREPLLFYAMRSIARSDSSDAFRSIFERLDRSSGSASDELPIAVTAAVEATHPAALPILIQIASGEGKDVGEVSRIVAIYTLRNYRDNPGVQGLLESFRAGSDIKLAAAAAEALTADR